jgi:hypothetical protein
VIKPEYPVLAQMNLSDDDFDKLGLAEGRVIESAKMR